ncbi:MAG: hypothetical protein WAU15_05395 [Nitrosomonas sp.]
MNENINQISAYLEMLPFWAIALFAFAIVGGIFIEIINRKRRSNAIENFRSTIETEFAALYPKHKVWPKNIQQFFAARMPEMYQNFEVLRLFIPQKRLLEYNTDWNNFRDFCRHITDEQCEANAYQSPKITDGQEVATEDPREVFHRLIDNLLKHTVI